MQAREGAVSSSLAGAWFLLEDGFLEEFFLFESFFF